MIGPYYWLVFAVATIFGASMGDFLSEYLGLGTVLGMPILAVALLVALLLERLDNRSDSKIWYWAAIVLIPIAWFARTLRDERGHAEQRSKVLVLLALFVAAPSVAQDRPDTADNPLYAIMNEVTSVLAQAKVPFTPEQERAMTLLMEDRRLQGTVIEPRHDEDATVAALAIRPDPDYEYVCYQPDAVRDVIRAGRPRQAIKRASRLAIPMRRTEADKCRNENHVVRIVGPFGHRTGVRRALDDF